MARRGDGQPSALLLDELFAAGDERFLPALREFHDAKRLAAFADRWARDHRPWARRQIFDYLDLPLDRVHHEPLVKRLFKHAEKSFDHELVGGFMVAFDRSVRRQVRNRYQYDLQARTSWTEEYLATPRDSIHKDHTSPQTAQRRGLRLFTHHTRNYLRRRAWRYFRRLGHQRPRDYAKAIAPALRRYRDADVASSLSHLDSWGLLHACFFHSDVLRFNPSHAHVREGGSLAGLLAAPCFPDLWKSADALPVLLDLVATAQSRALRTWAMQLVRRDHVERLTTLQAGDVFPLLDHADADVQMFGAELLERLSGLDQLPLDEWLRLLKTKNLTALETIASLMARHVRGDQLSLAQRVELATSEPVPAARLGLSYLRESRIESADDRATIAGVAAARASAVAGELARWALGVVGSREHYDVEHVTRFFDALLRPTRDAAGQWLDENAPGHTDAVLWSRLIETPYDDVRFRVVAELERRASLPGGAATSGRLVLLWSSVLLGIHRGGRQKLKALRQIERAIRDDPTAAATLLPVLAVGVRSVRLPEARGGLSAVVGAVEALPDLGPLVRRYLPELDLTPPQVPSLRGGTAA